MRSSGVAEECGLVDAHLGPMETVVHSPCGCGIGRDCAPACAHGAVLHHEHPVLRLTDRAETFALLRFFGLDIVCVGGAAIADTGSAAADRQKDACASASAALAQGTIDLESLQAVDQPLHLNSRLALLYAVKSHIISNDAPHVPNLFCHVSHSYARQLARRKALLSPVVQTTCTWFNALPGGAAVPVARCYATGACVAPVFGGSRADRASGAAAIHCHVCCLPAPCSYLAHQHSHTPVDCCNQVLQCALHVCGCNRAASPFSGWLLEISCCMWVCGSRQVGR